MSPDFITFAHALEGPDRGPLTAEPQLLRALADPMPAWVHLDGTNPAALQWISQQLDYLDPQAIESLLDVDTRPRLTLLGDGLLINLRALNHNIEEYPEDMVSIRMWVDSHRIVTISRRNVAEIQAMHRRMQGADAPQSAGEFLVRLIEDVVASLAAFQSAQDEKVEALETQVIAESRRLLRKDIVDLRLQIITIRRFLGPLRDVLDRLARAEVPFIDQTTYRELEEEHLKLTRVVEDLDELRDKTMVLREELSGQLSDRLTHHMYVLSLLTAIFLPLSFLTGLFGVNLAGMPGAATPGAFYVLCLVLGAIFAMQLLMLVLFRWIGRGR